jgi:hypothetical protein
MTDPETGTIACVLRCRAGFHVKRSSSGEPSCVPLSLADIEAPGDGGKSLECCKKKKKKR